MNIWKTIKILFIIGVISIPVGAVLRHHYSPQAKYNEARKNADEAIYKLDRYCITPFANTGASAWDTTKPDCAEYKTTVKNAEKILLDPKYKKNEKVWQKTVYDPDDVYDGEMYEYTQQIFDESDYIDEGAYKNEK